MKFKISFEALFVLYNAILKCTSMAELNVWKKKSLQKQNLLLTGDISNKKQRKQLLFKCRYKIFNHPLVFHSNYFDDT